MPREHEADRMTSSDEFDVEALVSQDGHAPGDVGDEPEPGTGEADFERLLSFLKESAPSTSRATSDPA